MHVAYVSEGTHTYSKQIKVILEGFEGGKCIFVVDYPFYICCYYVHRGNTIFVTIFVARTNNEPFLIYAINAYIHAGGTQHYHTNACMCTCKCRVLTSSTVVH